MGVGQGRGDEGGIPPRPWSVGFPTPNHWIPRRRGRVLPGGPQAPAAGGERGERGTEEVAEWSLATRRDAHSGGA